MYVRWHSVCDARVYEPNEQIIICFFFVWSSFIFRLTESWSIFPGIRTRQKEVIQWNEMICELCASTRFLVFSFDFHLRIKKFSSIPPGAVLRGFDSIVLHTTHRWHFAHFPKIQPYDIWACSICMACKMAEIPPSVFSFGKWKFFTLPPNQNRRLFV